MREFALFVPAYTNHAMGYTSTCWHSNEQLARYIILCATGIEELHVLSESMRLDLPNS